MDIININDPLHDLAGYRQSEVYNLPDGRVVTKASWDGPLIGWDFLGAVYLDSMTGLIDKLALTHDFKVTPLGYRVFLGDVPTHYVKQDGSLITEEEFATVVERLRQDGYAVENFQHTDGAFSVVPEPYPLPTPPEEPPEVDSGLTA